MLVVKHGGEVLLAEGMTLESGRLRRLSVPAREPVSPERLSAPERAPKPPIAWTSSATGMAFVRIEGGQFLMGSADGDNQANEDEKPQHRVQISEFYMGVTEATQAQYGAVMGRNPSWFRPGGGGKEQVEGQATQRHPVEYVKWFEAIKFCNTMSAADDLVPYYDIQGSDPSPEVRIPDRRGTGYRLPTEAEWEYACRAGTTTNYCFGDDPAKLGEHAWTGENSLGQTHPVHQKGQNAFGLFDMHGNVWEWCWDGYDSEYYRRSPNVDPPGPDSADNRVARGGCWLNWPGSYCRSAVRSAHLAGKKYGSAGIRVARNLAGELKAQPSVAGSSPPMLPATSPSQLRAMPASTAPKPTLGAEEASAIRATTDSLEKQVHRNDVRPRSGRRIHDGLARRRP